MSRRRTLLIALVLMYIGFRYFGTTVGGLFSPEYEEAPWSWGRVGDLVWHLPLPAIILGLGSTAQVMRVMRANLLDELRKPYLITALARGMPLWRAILKYPVRVALNPFISTIGYILPYVVSGSVIVSLVLVGTGWIGAATRLKPRSGRNFTPDTPVYTPLFH